MNELIDDIVIVIIVFAILIALLGVLKEILGLFK